MISNREPSVSQKVGEKCHKNPKIRFDFWYPKRNKQTFGLLKVNSRGYISIERPDKMNKDLKGILDRIPKEEKKNERAIAIKYIRNKIEYLKGLILGDYVHLKKLIEEDARKKARMQLRIERWVKNIDSPHTSTFAYSGFEAENPLFFNLETTFMEIKRCIEFSIKMIAENKGFTIKKFSLQEVISLLSGQDILEEKIKEKAAKKFLDFLKTNHLEYFKFLQSKSTWLQFINSRRNMVAHVEVINKSSSFKVDLFWDAGKSFKDEAEVRMPEIPFADRPILIFVDHHLEELDKFLMKTLTLGGSSLND